MNIPNFRMASPGWKRYRNVEDVAVSQEEESSTEALVTLTTTSGHVVLQLSRAARLELARQLLEGLPYAVAPPIRETQPGGN